MILRLPPSLTILARGGEYIGERGMRAPMFPTRIPPALIKAVLTQKTAASSIIQPRPFGSFARRWQKLALWRGRAGRLYDHTAARQEPVP